MKDKPKEYDRDHSIEHHDFEQFKAGDSPESLAKQQRFIQDAIYSRAFESAIRETLCNAVDAHLDDGTKKAVDIRVGRSSELGERAVVIKDHGTGMSKHKLDNVFPVYHRSTKDEDNRMIGGYGNGAKVPFAHADRFAVKTVHGGLKNVRIAKKHEEGDRFYKTEVNAQTAQPNGTEVHIPLNGKTEEDVYSIIRESMYYMPHVMPVRAEGRDLSLFSKNEIKDSGHFGSLITRFHYDPAPKNVYYHLHGGAVGQRPAMRSVSVGGVLYQVPKDFVHFGDYDLPTHMTLLLPIGSIDLDGARENIKTTEKTQKTLEKALSEVRDDARDHFFSGALRSVAATPPVERYFRVQKLAQAAEDPYRTDLSEPKVSFAPTINRSTITDFEVHFTTNPFSEFLQHEKVTRSKNHSGGYKTTRKKATEDRVQRALKESVDYVYFGDADNDAAVNATLFEKHNRDYIIRIVPSQTEGVALANGIEAMLEDFRSGGPLPLYSEVDVKEDVSIPEAGEKVLYYEIEEGTLDRRQRLPRELETIGEEKTAVYGHQADLSALKRLGVAAEVTGREEEFVVARVAKSRAGRFPDTWTHVGDTDVIEELLRDIALSEREAPSMYTATTVIDEMDVPDVESDVQLMKETFSTNSVSISSYSHSRSDVEDDLYNEAMDLEVTLPKKVADAKERIETLEEALSPVTIHSYSGATESQKRLVRLYLESEHSPYSSQYSNNNTKRQ